MDPEEETDMGDILLKLSQWGLASDRLRKVNEKGMGNEKNERQKFLLWLRGSEPN